MAPRHVGLDLDNTIIDYDHAFAAVAIELGLAPPGARGEGKHEIKERICSGPEGERAWMRLQGQIYGARIQFARPHAGAKEALIHLRTACGAVSVVSHKTKFGHFDATGVDLREAARGWLRHHGLIGSADAPLSEADVYFEPDREAKIERINVLHCDAFVDDLLEVLEAPGFPKGVRRLWFRPGTAVPAPATVVLCRSWAEIVDALR